MCALRPHSTEAPRAQLAVVRVSASELFLPRVEDAQRARWTVSGRRAAPVFLNLCTTMGKTPRSREPMLLSNEPAARRRARLRRGIDRWGQVLELDGGPRRGALLLSFTTRSSDVEAVTGQMRRFWAQVRKLYGVQRYFCWLELQQRGAAHYHAIWVDPPFLQLKSGDRWLERAWGLGHVHDTWRDRRWVQRRSLRYVKSYAKKIGDKQSQQNYAKVPSSIRTFMCNRNGIPAELLDAHRDRTKFWVRLVSLPQTEPWLKSTESQVELTPESRDVHVPPKPGYCSLRSLRITSAYIKRPLRTLYERSGLHAKRSITVAPLWFVR